MSVSIYHSVQIYLSMCIDTNYLFLVLLCFVLLCFVFVFILEFVFFYLFLRWLGGVESILEEIRENY